MFLWYDRSMIMWIRRHAIVLILIALTLTSLVGRLSVIASPDEIAGDEIYFVNFARAYFGGDIYYDVHPPLGKLIIAAGIGLFGDNPFGWRVSSAVLGTALVPLLYWFGATLFRRRGIGLTLAALAAADGYIFVLSRVAAMDVGLLLLLLVGYTLLIRQLRQQTVRWRPLIIVGIIFGLAWSVKWFAATWVLVTGVVFFYPSLVEGVALGSLSWQRRLQLWLGGLLVPALIVYGLVWSIHFLFFAIPLAEYARYFGIYNFRIFNYHTHIVDTSPYTSPWWSWPLLFRPWQYFHETSAGSTQLIVVLGTPIIWWSALVAFIPTVKLMYQRYRPLVFVSIMLLVHWVPFVLVQRPMFNYHFLMAWPFFMIPLAVLLYHWRTSNGGRIAIGIFTLVIVCSIIFFWPIWNAVPLTEAMLRWRLWLPSWL